METLFAIGLALLFGLGVSLTVLALSLFYKVFFASNNYSSPVVIIAMAGSFLWLGVTFIFFVIV